MNFHPALTLFWTGNKSLTFIFDQCTKTYVEQKTTHFFKSLLWAEMYFEGWFCTANQYTFHVWIITLNFKVNKTVRNCLLLFVHLWTVFAPKKNLKIRLRKDPNVRRYGCNKANGFFHSTINMLGLGKTKTFVWHTNYTSLWPVYGLQWEWACIKHR